MKNDESWKQGVTAVCAGFQLDLSCLVDGELGDAAAQRAVRHLETCAECQGFFDDARLQVRLHRDLNEPGRLVEQFALLTGSDTASDLDEYELVHRLATIFYQLGKAYVLIEFEPGIRNRVFEEPVKVEPTRARGRGLVDGVLARGDEGLGGVDWTSVRGLLNGKLSRIEGALEKGLRLLGEALQVDPSHEEARLYIGFTELRRQRPLRAARVLREVFDGALDLTNRGHAAVQLGLMHGNEEEYRRALVYFRWVTLSGLADRDDRFFCVRFNIGTYYAYLGDVERSVGAFRDLFEKHPEHLRDVVDLFAASPRLRAIIDSTPGFPEAMLSLCPELPEVFGSSGTEPGSQEAVQ